jgi:hypothetical protein
VAAAISGDGRSLRIERQPIVGLHGGADPDVADRAAALGLGTIVRLRKGRKGRRALRKV